MGQAPRLERANPLILNHELTKSAADGVEESFDALTFSIQSVKGNARFG